MNILAFYLPQYHSIPENDVWWGKDYTEWDSLRRGEKLMEGQYQPRIPLNKNYYNLLDVNIMKRQAELAEKAGIYGFCVYHYWFNGKLLLEKPMENLLRNTEIDFPFCFCWANEDWTNIWEGNLEKIKVLISNRYDDPEDWKKHFEYFLPFFRDSRYIKLGNKPLLVIYNPLLIGKMREIVDCWNEMARDAGFDGIVFMYQTGKMLLSNDSRKNCFDYGIEYYPGLAAIGKKSATKRNRERLLHSVASFVRGRLGINVSKKLHGSEREEIREVEDYDAVWEYILSRDVEDASVIPGAFVDWDNTPRKRYAGKVILGATPDKFRAYLTAQIRRAKKVYKKNLLFIFAWNEWSEGGYLEPDEKYGYGYLEAVHDALSSTGELPDRQQSFTIDC